MGERLALAALDERGVMSASLTYRDLDRRAASIAAFLETRVAPGDRVVLAFHDQVESACALLGCAYAGAIGVPLAMPASGKHDKGRFARIRAAVANCTPALALASAHVAEHVWPHAAGHGVSLDCVSMGDIDAALQPRRSRATPGFDQLFYLQYTSGSTGDPRGVRVSHGNVVANVHALRDLAKIDPSGPCVSWLPHYHDLGLVTMMLYPLYFASTAYLMVPATFLKRPVRWLEALSRYRAASTAAPNFAYEYCVRRIAPDAIAGLDLTALTSAINGAEPISADTLERFSQAFAPIGFRRSAWAPAYGLAEATVLVTAYRSDRGYQTLQTAGGKAAVSCGPPASDTSLRIVDPERHVRLADGERGEILVSGPSVTSGYWGRSGDLVSLRDEARDREYLATGDVGTVVDGELYVVGRIKDIVIVNGTNHHAVDIEATIRTSIDIAATGSCAVFGAQIEGLERLVAAIELERGQPRSRDELLAAVRKAVAETHDITVFDVVPLLPGRLPRTSSGKVRRHACRELYALGELR